VIIDNLALLLNGVHEALLALGQLHMLVHFLGVVVLYLILKVVEQKHLRLI
jgi:hypothetical protein